MRIGILIILFIAHIQSLAQVRLSNKIDTTNTSILNHIKFINTYFQKDTIDKEMWHPKYQDRIVHDYTMDWLWQTKSPKELSKLFDLQLVEFGIVNDSLSYFKIVANNREKPITDFANVFKYYIVKVGSKFYMDNCKEYESRRFREVESKYLRLYISPFLVVDQKKISQADRAIEDLYKLLKRPALERKIEYYMCSNEEELNLLSNTVIWDGGLGAYTNIPDGCIVAINNNPVYKHEFIHAIMGSSANCFFLQEGLAVLYGGLDKGTKSYEDGILTLKACFEKGECNFENLYTRQIKQQFNSNLTYAFAGAFCKYLIENYGLVFFYKLYFNKEITTTNFIEKVSEVTGKTKSEIKKGVEKLILLN